MLLRHTKLMHRLEVSETAVLVFNFHVNFMLAEQIETPHKTSRLLSKTV